MSAASATPAETASPILSEEYRRNPYPVIHRLREEDPVHTVPMGGVDFLFVTRYDDVRRLLTDSRVTNDPRAFEHYVPPPEGSFMEWVSEHGLFSLPPAEHARVRRLVSAAFTPRAIARMEDQVREVVARFAEPLAGRGGVVDLMAEFTDPIPNAVISRITGIPAAGDDEEHFRRLAQATIRGFFSFADPEVKREGNEAFQEIADWVRVMAQERRRQPREDLITDLVQIRDRDDRMSDDEIVSLVTGLIGAGSETTAIGAMAALLTLFDHPAEMERLRADRSLLPVAVSELLRFSFGGPGGLPRYAVADFELRGKRVRKGQMLMLSFAGASRDPAVYPDPDRFDLERDPKDLLTFGNGPHYCLGVHLARAEMRWMIDAALDFLPPGASVLRDEMQFVATGFFRRPETLPVDFGGAEEASSG